ncbi:MAG TPA: diaminopimelate decarboxylase, partial [Bacillota bacterium]
LQVWLERYGSEVAFQIEPGRYVVAESGVLLGTVHSVKESYGTRYVGTDLGFNVLARPVLYDAYHEMEAYDAAGVPKNAEYENVTVVGNICESGDILARERNLPRMEPGDLIGVLDAGAYGYSMCSNYNNRLRPAEVLIRMDGTPALIRRRETLKDLSRLDPDLSDTIHSSEGDDEIEVRGARRRAVGGQVF